MSPKRACDTCISRKVKCSGSWPCDTCGTAVKRVQCTYLRPAGRRGPKAKRRAIPNEEIQDAFLELPELHTNPVMETQTEQLDFASDAPLLHRISKTTLATIIQVYRQHSYSVWPVIHTQRLLQKLETIQPKELCKQDESYMSLMTALCAATMAQLQLPPMMDQNKNGMHYSDATTMAHVCMQIRGKCWTHGESLDLRSILTSFFLHVYHAKVNQRTSAMMFIEEAISGSRILRLNEGLPQPPEDVISHPELVFPLLWVSERGYSLHLGLLPSYMEPPILTGFENSMQPDIHTQGLLELVRLFIAFDQISVRRKSHTTRIVATDLTNTEMQLSALCFGMIGHVSTRTADYHITREWMRMIIWQEALALGLLSSTANAGVMTFGFPSKVGRDLLQALSGFCEADLLPLGRDQLLKCFEVANSLADTVLLKSVSMSSRCELGPHDFLHALYQKIVPFLERDRVLLSILRAKTAEALVTAPARLLTMDHRISDLHAVEREITQSTDAGRFPSSQEREQQMYPETNV